ncbi:hypothetical protein GGQ60_001072 [Pedobacter zeae]|uniref:Uncharacterized protein n=1 Tax=Pedobacter zeae TaxID=1737356 RepID=A0A7W6K8L3_9SPHI|nr:hypothetical protein [Pedobacter zeae]
MINKSTPQFRGVFKQKDEKCSYHSPPNWVIPACRYKSYLSYMFNPFQRYKF